MQLYHMSNRGKSQGHWLQINCSYCVGLWTSLSCKMALLGMTLLGLKIVNQIHYYDPKLHWNRFHKL